MNRWLVLVLLLAACGRSRPLAGADAGDAAQPPEAAPPDVAQADVGQPEAAPGDVDGPTEAPTDARAQGAACRDGGRATRTFGTHEVTNRKIDILVVLAPSVKNSRWMGQNAALPAFEGLPGGVPDVHIAVVTADLGAGPYLETQVPGCRSNGDRGRFRTTSTSQDCRDNHLLDGQTFISNSGGTPNFTGNMNAVFRCMAGAYQPTCRFPQPLAAAQRALGADGSPPPPENAGFLRPDALLFVVMVAQGEDCSVRPNGTLFDPGSTSSADPLGALSTYRCTEFGLLCGGRPPPHTVTSPQRLEACRSAEDGRLMSVSVSVFRLRALKSDPSKVYLYVFGGPSDSITVSPSTTFTEEKPGVEMSCYNPENVYAWPSIRLRDAVDAFGANGLFTADHLCNAEPLHAAIDRQIAQAMAGTLACLDADGDPAACAFVQRGVDAQDASVEIPVLACGPPYDSTRTCWGPSSNNHCGAGTYLEFSGGSPGVVQSTISATCEVCAAP